MNDSPLFERVRTGPAPDLWPEIERRIGHRPGQPPGHRRERAVAVAVALALTVGGLAAVWVAFGRAPAKRAQLTQPVLVGTVHVPGGATDVAFGAGSLWVPGRGDVKRIDPTTGRVVVRIVVPGSSDYRYVALGDGSVWLTDTGQRDVYRIDTRTNRVVARVPVPCPVAVSFGSGFVWVVSNQPVCGDLPATTVVRIDPRTNAVVGRPIHIGPQGNFAVGDGQVWIGSSDGTKLLRIDPRTLRVLARTRFADTFSSPTVGYGALWVPAHPFVVRVDPATGSFTGISILAPGPIAIGEGGVWVTSAPVPIEPGTLMLIDPSTNKTVGRPVRVGMTPVGIAVGGGSVWVLNNDDTLSRIESSAGIASPSARVLSPPPADTGATAPVEEGGLDWSEPMGPLAVRESSVSTAEQVITFTPEVPPTSWGPATIYALEVGRDCPRFS